MSILDCNFPAIMKGLEAIKAFGKIIDSDPSLKIIIGDLKVYVNDDVEGIHRIGYWKYFDEDCFEFYEDS